jgi:hypothetical protein
MRSSGYPHLFITKYVLGLKSWGLASPQHEGWGSKTKVNAGVRKCTGKINASNNSSPGIPSMSTWVLIIGEIKCLYYNVCNTLIQPLHYNSALSWGHYGLLRFTNISVPNHSQADTRPLLDRLCPIAFGNSRPPAWPLGGLVSYPSFEKMKPKPLYVFSGCSNHMYRNNMINRCNVSIKQSKYLLHNDP